MKIFKLFVVCFCIFIITGCSFSNKDIDNSPPIYPFFGNHANTYSQPKEGDEVWVLNLSDNSRQLYWFRKDKTDRIKK